jgi:hypothetical protein
MRKSTSRRFGCPPRDRLRRLGVCQQLRVDGATNHHSAFPRRAPEQASSLWRERTARPDHGNGIRVDGGSHCPCGSSSRRCRIQAAISSLPPGNVPKLPTYFSKGFAGARAGRMTVRLPSSTNSTRSPTRRPKRLRILCGTVTCPFVLITLDSVMFLPALPTVRIGFPTDRVKLFSGTAGECDE